jgi:eukaryotic-like serine/threonine-protein kinase
MAKETATVSATEEDRLSHALISRGLVTAEEIEHCRNPADSPAGTEVFLQRLVKAGYLTPSQAKRSLQEMSELVKHQIPGYQLLDRLGQGAMGTVFKSRQLSMNRLVAIKVLSPRLAANPTYIERFTREAHVAAKLSHNNIVQAIDVGSAGKIQFFVMEYVEGTTIQQELDKGKIYEEREAVDIVLQIAQALQHAHKRGLIHRDIKPANIILTKDRIAKLADLGLARQTRDRAQAAAEKGLAVGTPYYISPEQIYGQEDVDCRADIYALGATLYHMVTGQPPFPGKNVDKVFTDHLEKELTPPDHLNTELSAGLGEVVEFMMAKDRKQRYRTPDEMIVDLECLLAGEAPRLARQHFGASALSGLTGGEVDDEDERGSRADKLNVVWLSVLGGLLGLSALFNLILLLKKG